MGRRALVLVLLFLACESSLAGVNNAVAAGGMAGQAVGTPNALQGVLSLITSNAPGLDASGARERLEGALAALPKDLTQFGANVTAIVGNTLLQLEPAMASAKSPCQFIASVVLGNTTTSNSTAQIVLTPEQLRQLEQTAPLTSIPLKMECDVRVDNQTVLPPQSWAMMRELAEGFSTHSLTDTIRRNLDKKHTDEEEDLEVSLPSATRADLQYLGRLDDTLVVLLDEMGSTTDLRLWAKAIGNLDLPSHVMGADAAVAALTGRPASFDTVATRVMSLPRTGKLLTREKFQPIAMTLLRVLFGPTLSELLVPESVAESAPDAPAASTALLELGTAYAPYQKDGIVMGILAMSMICLVLAVNEIKSEDFNNTTNQQYMLMALQAGIAIASMVLVHYFFRRHINGKPMRPRDGPKISMLIMSTLVSLITLTFMEELYGQRFPVLATTVVVGFLLFLIVDQTSHGERCADKALREKETRRLCVDIDPATTRGCQPDFEIDEDNADSDDAKIFALCARTCGLCRVVPASEDDREGVRALIRPIMLNIIVIWLFALLYYNYRSQNSGITSFSDALYMSVITHTTVGYGDKNGNETPTAQALALTHMIVVYFTWGATLYSVLTSFASPDISALILEKVNALNGELRATEYEPDVEKQTKLVDDDAAGEGEDDESETEEGEQDDGNDKPNASLAGMLV